MKHIRSTLWLFLLAAVLATLLLAGCRGNEPEETDTTVSPVGTTEPVGETTSPGSDTGIMDPTVSAPTTSVDSFLLRELEDGTYAIVSYVGSDATVVHIPSFYQYQALEITRIDERAFENCTELTKVIVPSSIITIGEGAFSGCSSLESITLPFVGMKADGSGKTHFGHIFGASSYSLNSKCVPASLKTVVITGGESIAESAFSGCGSLTSVTIPDSVTSLGANAFDYCGGLQYNTYDNAYYLGNMNNPYMVLVKAKNKTITSCQISEKAKFIGSGAFRNCSDLTSITIGEAVTSIGNRAFEDCIGLSSVIIPDGVTSIGFYAFSGCRGLSGITIGNGVEYIASGAFYDCEKLQYNTYDNAYYLGNANNPYIALAKAKNNAITSCRIFVKTQVICDSVFKDCTALKSITIPDGVMSIGASAFYNCNSLTSVTIGDGVTSIGGDAFAYCTGLLSITIPNGVMSIGASAFCNCTGLLSITIPDSVTSIGSSVFSGCTGLSSITIPFVGEKADGSGKTHFGYIFGASSYSDNDDSIPVSLKTVVLTGGETIGERAFSGCTGLTSIEIPDSITSIGAWAFSGCTNLSYTTYDNALYLGNFENRYLVLAKAKDTTITSCQIPVETKFIYEGALSYCTALSSIVIPDSVTSIGGQAFYGCTGLSSITIPNGVMSIGASAFSGCTGLLSITIPDSVTSIGGDAFYNCNSLTSVTIGDGVTSIGGDAFAYCTGLSSITIPDSVTSIGGDAFHGCYKLVEVYNCSSLTITKGDTGNGYVGYYALNVYTPTLGISKLDSIDDYRFYADGDTVYLMAYRGSDTALTLPTDYQGKSYAIYQYAFYGCTDLSSIAISNRVTSIGQFAFSGCTGLSSITIPDSVASIGSYAFYGCSSLQSMTLPFVGEKADGSGKTYFGYIFGASSYQDNFAFVSASLKTVVITGGESIGRCAFYDCNSLTSVTIGDGVTSIGSAAFQDCDGLKSATIGSGVTSIDRSAFYDCSGLSSVTFADPDTWYRTISSSYSNGTQIDVTSPSQNATYFTSTYVDHYWYKK